jgi:ParB family chromosome partitioning protein
MATVIGNRLARQAAGQTKLDFDPLGRDEPKLMTLPCRLIDPDPNQPRRDLGSLDELMASIREQGVIQPLIVEPHGNGRYRILAGERRYTASQRLGLETVPCVVRTVADHSRLALQLIENLHRKDLNPLEKAQGYRRLMDEFQLTQRDLALRLGKSLASVNQTLRLLDLSQDIRRDVQTSEHANQSLLLEIAKVTDPEQQQALWAKAKAGELTVRRARLANPAQPGDRPAATSWTLELGDAEVVVRFQAGTATAERVRTALEQALRRCPGLD